LPFVSFAVAWCPLQGAQARRRACRTVIAAGGSCICPATMA
jgi:hypothetical protein